MNYQTYKTKIDGIYLNYVKVGSGKPLVLIHGWTNNWEGYIPLVSNLKKYFTLYILDLPGFGDSGNLEYYSIEKSASYVAMFLKLLNLNSVSLIGFSMGTFVASSLALNFPDLIKSLVLIGPPVKNRTNFSGNRILKTTLRSFDNSQFTKKILQKIIRSKKFTYVLAKYVNMYKFNKNLVDLYGMKGKEKLRIDAFIDMGLSFSNTNLAQIISALEVPTLLIYGREDKVAPPKYAQTIPNENVQISVIPFAGHMTFWEKPKEVANSINIFLRKSSES